MLMSRCVAWLVPQSAADEERRQSLDPGHVAAISAAISRFENDKLNK